MLTAVPIDLDFADSPQEETRYFTFSVSRATVSDGSRGVLGVIVETTEQVTAARRIRVLSGSDAAHCCATGAWCAPGPRWCG